MLKGLALLLLLVAVGHAQYGQSSKPVNRGPPARYQGERPAPTRQQYTTTTTTTSAPKVEVTEAAVTTYAPPTQPPRAYINPASVYSAQPVQYPAAAAVAPQQYSQPAPVIQYQQQKQAVPQYTAPAPVLYEQKPVAAVKVEQVKYEQLQKAVPVQVAVYSAPAAPVVPVTQRPIAVSVPKVAAVIKEAQTEEPDVNTLPGQPGKDYPIYSSIPKTSFSCSGKIAGYYADVEAGCQAWHYCSLEGLVDSFLCTNGTIYSQENRVCDWWFNVDCSQTSKNYDVNKDLYIIPSTTKAPVTVVKAAEVYAPVASAAPVKVAVEQRPVSYDAPQKAPVTVYEVPSYPAPAAPQTPPPAPVTYRPEAPRQQRVRPAQQQRYQQQQQQPAAQSYY